jgi:hypothetical protein
MLRRRKKPDASDVAVAGPVPDSYELHKADMRLRMAEKVALGQEIGPIPEVVDADRKESCRNNLQLFAETYVRGLFKGVSKRWAAFHIDAFTTLQQAVFDGGLFAIAVPRGSGKTAIIKAAIIWAAVYGHCHFAVVVCATQPVAVQFLRSIKKQLRVSRILFEDFPEVCHPVRKIDNKAGRCNGQKLYGVRTAIEWGYAHIVLATVPGFKCSGFKIALSGITGSALRGLVDAKEDGTEERPDVVAIDDFQTPGSAKSVKQTNARMDIIQGSILGMAGPGEKMAVAAAVTVIQRGDGADQLLDDPNFQTIRHGILSAIPTNMKRWREYADVRKEAKAQRLGIGPGNDFYLKHRTELNEGCEATWPDRFDPTTEIDAVQAAMNLYFRVGPTSWWAEYMNTPQAISDGTTSKITPVQVRNRLNGLDRGVVPKGFDFITIGCDIQLRLLWYVATAWKWDMTGSVIDYRWAPDQVRTQFTLDDLETTLQDASGAVEEDVDAAVSWGLMEMGKKLFEDNPWLNEDGVEIFTPKGQIDINYRASQTAVGRFCRTSKWKAIFTPAVGVSMLRNRRRISEWKPQEGELHPKPEERRDCEWMVTNPKASGKRECYFDPNHWKSFVNTGFALPLHSPGSLSLFGTNPEEHIMFSEHITSHYAVEVTYNGSRQTQWILKPGVDRDDLLDCLVGCSVSASREGARLTRVATAIPVVKPVKRKRGTKHAQTL